MQTLKDYFSYNNDYSEINKIFYGLSKKMKDIHNDGMIIANFSSSSIVYDNDFNYEYKQIPNVFDVEKKNNNLSFAKLLLGTYLSLSTGFKDFSQVSTEWFQENIEEICSSITTDNFFSEYFLSLFVSGNNEYYCDYLDRKKQEATLGGETNTVAYKKVLSNSASAFYEHDDEDELEIFDSSNKSALINEIFYPVLLFCFLVIIICFILIFIK